MLLRERARAAFNCIFWQPVTTQRCPDVRWNRCPIKRRSCKTSHELASFERPPGSANWIQVHHANNKAAPANNGRPHLRRCVFRHQERFTRSRLVQSQTCCFLRRTPLHALFRLTQPLCAARIWGGLLTMNPASLTPVMSASVGRRREPRLCYARAFVKTFKHMLSHMCASSRLCAGSRAQNPYHMAALFYFTTRGVR